MDPSIILMVVLASTAGAVIGTFTGLIPGIHVNTAATVLLGAYPLMENIVAGYADPSYTPVLVSCCIMSASAVHSFVDFVPSVFIGSPDADETISVLPGHRMLGMGLGMAAVRSAAIGSVVGSLTALALAIPIQWIMLRGALEYIDYFTTGVLVVTLAVVVINSDRPLVSILLVAVSGLLGYAIGKVDVVQAPVAGGTLLFPLLSGLFGLPPLLEHISGGRQVVQKDDVRDPVGPVPGLKGVVTGLVAGWFPGVTSTAGAMLAATFTEEKNPARFISMTASIGTVTAVFSIITLSVSGSGRTGTCMAVKEIIGDALEGFCSEALLMMLVSMALASAFGYASTIMCGKAMSRIYSGIPEHLLNNVVLGIILCTVFLFTGPFGLALLTVSAAVGMVPPRMGVGRICLTGCLMVPVLIG